MDLSSPQEDQAPTISQAVPSGLPFPAYCPDFGSDSGIAPAKLFGATKSPNLLDKELLSGFATNSSSVDTPAETVGLSVPPITFSVQVQNCNTLTHPRLCLWPNYRRQLPWFARRFSPCRLYSMGCYLLLALASEDLDC